LEGVRVAGSGFLVGVVILVMRSAIFLNGKTAFAVALKTIFTGDPRGRSGLRFLRHREWCGRACFRAVSTPAALALSSATGRPKVEVYSLTGSETASARPERQTGSASSLFPVEYMFRGHEVRADA
jgi:hypothetical protein